MIGPKDLLAKIIFQLRITAVFAGRVSSHLVVFGYHRIRADSDQGDHPFDDETLGPTVSEFRRQVEWLQRTVEILDENRLIEMTRGGNSAPVRGAAITFDDGYRDSYSLASPVLRELGVPGFFFIPTGLIDQGRLGWWDVIPFVIKHARVSRLRFLGRDFALPSQAREATAHVQEHIKLTRGVEPEELVTRLADSCQAHLPGQDRQAAELMTWREIRELAASGVTIGSHTCTHRVLKTLETNDAQEELERSKRALEERTGQEIRTLAYPCGGYDHYDASTKALAAKAGYELAFSFNTGVNRSSNLDALDIRRLGAPTSVSRLAGMAVFPEVFSWSV